MTLSKRVVSVVFSLGLLALASGCFNRQLVRFQTHEAKPVVLMETLDTTDYWLWSDNEHVFWSCAESSDALNCSRRCGKDSGLECPELSIFNNQVGSNAR
jgi:hypothetical protein